MNITYKKFPSGSSYKGISTVTIGRVDLLHSVVMVGQGRARVSIRDFIAKFTFISSFLSFNSGEIELQSNVDYLEQTEQTFLSYILGMAITDFILRNQFNASITLHASFGYYKVGHSIIGKNEKFDLIGVLKNKDLIAAEAKGSINKPASPGKALKQVKSALINGTVPSYRLAMLQGFKSGELVVNVIDPYEKQEHNYDLNINIDEKIKKLYDNLGKEFSNSKVVKINGVEYRSIEFSGYEVALKQEIISMGYKLQDNQLEYRRKIDGYYVFNSGLAIKSLLLKD